MFFINCILFLYVTLQVTFSTTSRPSSHSNRDQDEIQLDDLRNQIRKHKPTFSNDNHTTFRVPNIVHYIWYNTNSAPLKFHHLLSVLSAHKFIRPDVIYFHTDNVPVGKYWEHVKKIPGLKVNLRTPPFTLFGERVKTPLFYTSHSNVDRVKILMEYGGIYLDLDVLVTNSFDDLRKHSCVVGQEQANKACGSVIVCEKTAFFLYLWINAYLDDYRMEEWAYNTGQVPFNLWKRFPHLVHMEQKINRPNFKELGKIWGSEPFDWKQNYAVHIWYRLWKDSKYYDNVEPDPETIKTMDNAFGQMARAIYYGSPEIISLYR